MPENDPLAPFRKSGSPASAPAATSAPAPVKARSRDEGYEAFHAADGALYLKIRRPGEITHRPYYVGLLDVMDDEPHGTNGVLMYSSGLTVIITGRNLCGVFESIARHQVEWIEAFDPAVHSLPPDTGQPIIEGIEISYGDAGNAAGAGTPSRGAKKTKLKLVES